MAYQPNPVDTSHISLSVDVQELLEALARHNHDIWARLRIAEGWTYGPERDDQRKTHPCLVAYGQLPEAEKEYDRQAARETIKLLLALHWTLVPPAIQREPASREVQDDIQRALAQPAGASLGALFSLWRIRDSGTWPQAPEPYRLLADWMLKLGSPLMAYDVAQTGLRVCATDVRLRQLLALALSRSGASAGANAMVRGLYDAGQRDEETVGILARTHKDLAEAAIDAAQRQRHLREAYRLYREAYRATGGYWSGINAATLAVVLEARADATTLATEIRRRCRAELRPDSSQDDRYWLSATLGEAALIREDWDDAEAWYRAAANLGARNYGSLQSTRRNARLLLDHLRGDRERIDACFRIPSVAVFAGHLIDHSGRAEPCFPPELEGAVKAAIAERLRWLDVGFGYSSAACGSDILFLESVLERNDEAQLILPYDREEFYRDRVDIEGDGAWRTRYDAVLRGAVVTEASLQRLTHGSELWFEYGHRVLCGLADLRARELDTPLVGLVVWDGKHDGLGGTSGVVQLLRERHVPVEVIDLREMQSSRCSPYEVRQLPQLPGAPGAVPRPSPYEIRAVLFADVHNFTKLTEAQIPSFVEHFLGMVGRLIAAHAHPPLVKNTWGDGLYLVFPDVRGAGLFALDLCQRVGATTWTDNGLPELSMRVGVHAGPLYRCTDPVTRARTYTGAHVSRAARIEPITPEGQVYASQQFAALAAVDGVTEFACEYVGRIPQAKGCGECATYVVRRRD